MNREQLHSQQHYTDCDIGSIKLMRQNGDYILLNVGEDGTAKYAILNDVREVPNYYTSCNIILHGKYKIMTYDCFDNFDDEGTEIEGNYIFVNQQY